MHLTCRPDRCSCVCRIRTPLSLPPGVVLLRHLEKYEKYWCVSLFCNSRSLARTKKACAIILPGRESRSCQIPPKRRLTGPTLSLPFSIHPTFSRLLVQTKEKKAFLHLNFETAYPQAKKPLSSFFLPALFLADSPSHWKPGKRRFGTLVYSSFLLSFLGQLG